MAVLTVCVALVVVSLIVLGVVAFEAAGRAQRCARAVERMRPLAAQFDTLAAQLPGRPS